MSETLTSIGNGVQWVQCWKLAFLRLNREIKRLY